MKIFSSFNVKVVNIATGKHLPEVQHHATTYAVAAPGDTFEVFVSRGQGDGYYPTVMVNLSVDGHDAGYSFNLPQGATVKFDGFLCNGALSGDTYTQFRFGEVAAAGNATNTAEHGTLKRAGTICVSFHNSVATTIPNLPPLGARTRDLAAAAPQMVEGKKWFMLPSLSVTEGSKVTRATNWSAFRYEKMSTIGEVVMRCETATTLLLRKVLNPQNAAHKAILDSAMHSSNAGPSRAQEGQHGSTCAAAARQGAAAAVPAGASASTSSAAAGVRVKREGNRAPGSSPAQQAAAVVKGPAILVDLCKVEMPELKVGRRRVAPDEFAICDLSQEEAAPMWAVRKKPCIDVVGPEGSSM